MMKLMKHDKTKRVYIVERLAEWDRDIVDKVSNRHSSFEYD